MSTESKVNTKNKKFTAQITCPSCSSSIEIYLDHKFDVAACGVCEQKIDLQMTQDHINGNLESCVCCTRKAFYQQKDFNRKIGIAIFVVAAILSIFTYGLSFVAFWLLDVFLFKKIGSIAICYKCTTIYRNAKNLEQIGDFDHQLHDRIVYSDYDPHAVEVS